MTNQHVKQNGKLEDNPATGSPPRTTLLGTIFSPVFNFFSPANKNGKHYLEACGLKAKNDVGWCFFLNMKMLLLVAVHFHSDLQT